MREAFVVLCVNAIGLTLVNNSPFIQEIVSVLESDDFLLLVGIVSHGFSHGDGTNILCADIVDFSDHVAREIVHKSELLLLRWLLHLLLINHVSRGV